MAAGVPGNKGRRVLALLRARLGGEDRGTSLPIAPLLMHGLVAAVLCGLVRGELPPFAYATFCLTITGALVAIPLLGELAHLLRADPAREWVEALPVDRSELGLARTLHLLIALGWLSLGSLLPAVLLAKMSLAERLLTFLGGLGLVASVGAALLLLQSLLRGRTQAPLVLLQTLLMVGVVVGFVMGLDLVPFLAEQASFGERWSLALPPAWFAAPLSADAGVLACVLPLGVAAAAILVLLFTPPAPLQTHDGGEPLLSILLRPARALATRFWLRADERGPFDLVYDALPREREVVLRTYPMIGIPLAFLAAGALGEEDGSRSDLHAVLLFTACVYLPVLLLHVPASESWRARWLVDTSPVDPTALAAGAVKAIAVRFLVPLYAVLALLAWAQSGPSVVLRLALPGFLLSLLITRRVYRACVEDPPLSVAPDDVRAAYDWSGSFLGYAIGLTVLALFANRGLPTIPGGLGLAGFLLILEVLAERSFRRPRPAPKAS